MINIFVGNTGQGKSYMSAMIALSLLRRNKLWFDKKKTKTRRLVASNLQFNEKINAQYKDYIIYWDNLEQLVGVREADVIFDDMSAYLDSQRWADTPISVKRWLRLHEHYGCDIYGNAQDFLTIDPSVRRLTYSVFHVNKMIGSRRPAATKPFVKWIWGILIIRRVADTEMQKEKIMYQYDGWPKIEFIRRAICFTFDTTQDLQVSDWPTLHHIERFCSDENCKHHNIPIVKHA